MKRVFIIIIATIVLMTACTSNSREQDSDYISSEPLSSSGVLEDDSVLEDDVSSEPSLNHYVFYDESIRKEVEEYFEKTVEELNEEDFETLSNFTYFKVSNRISNLKDLPILFPNLKFLDLNLHDEGGLSLNDCNILEDMEGLLGVSILSFGRVSLEFAKDLQYVSFQYPEEVYLSNENNIGELSVLGIDFIKDHLIGNIKEYVRVIDNDTVYELICTDHLLGVDEYPYNEVKLFISEYSDNGFTYIDCLDVPDRIGNASGGLILKDVDFDGEKDILIKTGHHGNQGLVTYTCFLKRGNIYELNEGFGKICNPAVDEKNAIVLSAWRNSGSSHSHAMYSFKDGEFYETRRLTSEPDELGDEGVGNWKYADHKYVGDEVVGETIYLTKDYEEDEMRALLWDYGSFWELGSDKWRTLNNGGYYADFSIYSSSSIDAQISEIINSDESDIQ